MSGSFAAQAVSVLVTVLVVVTALVLVRRRFLTVTVTGRSMEPTLYDGDRVLVRRSPVEAVRAGQLVVLASPHAGTAWMIKRALAVPGDPVPRARVAALAGAAEPRVPADRLVVVGDNARFSDDSRRWGYLPGPLLLGIVVRHLPGPRTASEFRSWDGGKPTAGSGGGERRRNPVPRTGHFDEGRGTDT